MKQVAPLRYGVIFKKAFSQPDIFTAFVKDVLGIEFGCDAVETEKSFVQTIGNVKVEFDLYAEDKKIALLLKFSMRIAVTIMTAFCIIIVWHY
jgi:hypothetical protein